MYAKATQKGEANIPAVRKKFAGKTRMPKALRSVSTIMKAITGVGLSIALWGCGQAYRENVAMQETVEYFSEENEKEQAIVENPSASNETNNGFISSSAAMERQDTTRKFVRTADLKFKVKSIIQSTYDIEEIANGKGGFVTFTNLTSHIDNVTTTTISADSSLVTTYYTVTNTLTVRVPAAKLDMTLKEISRNIDFLDYRIIKAEDVALRILSNTLTQKRVAKNEKRLEKTANEKKLEKTAEELLLMQQEESDNARISNLSLADRIKFSTIHLSIYQRQTIKRELISNDQNIDAYEPSLGSKLVESLKVGWDILEAFLVFLTKLWGLFLFVFVAYIIYKKYRRKFKKQTKY